MSKRIVSVIAIVFCLAMSALAAAPQTLTGEVGDSMCGAKHMMQGASAADCTKDCVKSGSKYALIVGSKVYTLQGHEAELEKLAGQKAKVTGEVKGETVSVASVAAAK